MSGGWVAGSVRARAMVRRCIGTGAARELAACGSLREALQALAATPYGRERLPGLTLSAAQHGIASVILWDLRVLAGWLPGDGVRLLRALAGWFELANVEELLEAMAGRPVEADFALGALATAWPRLRQAASLAGLRAVLAASAWGDPGGETAEAVLLGMRSRWAARVAAIGDPARSWAAGAEALLLAGQRFAPGREAPDTGTGGAPGMLGAAAAGVVTLDELGRRLPARARWVLAGNQLAGRPVAGRSGLVGEGRAGRVPAAADLQPGQRARPRRRRRDGGRRLAGPRRAGDRRSRRRSAGGLR